MFAQKWLGSPCLGLQRADDEEWKKERKRQSMEKLMGENSALKK